jgi:hypothetical protein
MRKNYLSEVLADLIDEEHLTLAMKLDEHLRKRWEEASEDYKLVLEAFESKSGDNPAAEFAVYILLMQSMLEVNGG